MASIRERTSETAGKSWQVLFRHGNKQASKSFLDEKKAERFRQMVDLLGPDKALAELLSDDQPDRLTVDHLAERFLAWKTRDVTSRTLEDYRRNHENWIRPWFGHRAAETVDEADVQKWVDHMATQLAAKSVVDRHMLLHSIYKFGKAKTRRLVAHNPCEETEMPKAVRKPPKGTTLTEWQAILRAAETKNPDAGDLILFMGSLGWRWSEAAALAVGDVEDDGRFIWVDVIRVFRMVENKQVLIADAAKSFAGFRRSRVPSEAAAMLRRRIVGKAPNEYVFTNSRGTHWNQNTFLRETWPGLLTAAGVGTEDRKPTPHWLRHMAVGNMARANVPMHEIQRVVGHEEITTTNKTYGGMVSTLSEGSVAALDAVLAGKEAQTAVVLGEVVNQPLALSPSLDD